MSTPGRTPPSPAALEMERALLGACLVDRGAIPMVVACPSAVFEKDVHRAALDWIRATAADGDQPDMIALTLALEDAGYPDAAVDTARMFEAGELVSLLTLPGYVRKLRATAMRRGVARRGHALSEQALRNGAGPAPEALLAELDAMRSEAAALLGETAPGPAESCVVDATRLLATAFPDRPGPVQGIVERASFNLLGGDKGLGKTALTMNLLVRLTTGHPFLDFPTTPGRSLYIQAEIPEPHLKTRLALMVQDLEGPLPPGMLLTLTDRGIRLDAEAGQRRVRAAIEQYAPDVVGIDPLARFMSGDENRAQDMGRVVAFIDELIQRYSVAVLLVHHTAKPSRDEPRKGGQKLRGSSALYGAADSVLLLERRGDAFVLSFQLRHAAEPEPLTLRRTDRLWFERAPDVVPSELADVVRLVAQARLTYGELVEAVMVDQEASESTAERRVRGARRADLVAVNGGVYVLTPRGQVTVTPSATVTPSGDGEPSADDG